MEFKGYVGTVDIVLRTVIGRKRFFTLNVVNQTLQQTLVPSASQKTDRTGTIESSGLSLFYNSAQIAESKVLLDFVITHDKNNLTLYLNVEIYGLTFLGCLNSGFSRTILRILDKNCYYV